MRIDDNLNLVFPVCFDSKGSPTVYAYHTPIGQHAFEASYRVLAATKAALFSKGAAYAADVGPRIAALRLRDEGILDAIERGQIDESGAPRDSLTKALLEEIKRLTMILAAGPKGWQTLPVDEAIKQDVIEPSDWQEAESSIIFFCSAYCLARRQIRKAISEAIADILKGSITASSPLEWTASFQKSMKEEGSAKGLESDKPKAVSSVPT
jgi:hypothetical protein